MLYDRAPVRVLQRKKGSHQEESSQNTGKMENEPKLGTVNQICYDLIQKTVAFMHSIRVQIKAGGYWYIIHRDRQKMRSKPGTKDTCCFNRVKRSLVGFHKEVVP